uniref:Uncharacterized protein n=1 Tax=Porolithon onkodes TaxID=231751 RepID=A0A2Z2KSA6_9FLOR|nr:hypothetical protein [Porolithon onkodes]ASB29778.1 hypothetical protein [Porolithon onkodes]
MLSENMQNNSEHDVEFLFERPIGWSSACLDSTINYYLDYNNQDTHIDENTNIERLDS